MALVHFDRPHVKSEGKSTTNTTDEARWPAACGGIFDQSLLGMTLLTKSRVAALQL
jgi:hypothetical protein